MRLLLKLTANLSLVAFMIGCATPATKEIGLSKQEIKQEQQAQRDMARQYGKKKIVRKYKELGPYETRLNRVYPALLKATQQVCKKGECSYSFKVADQDVLNAWADGTSVNITPIMMDFLETDKELALILAHEISHNVMGHINKKMQNVLIGVILDVAAAAAGGVDTQGAFSNVGSRYYSQGFENEADYVGIYIMALAGYDISNVNHLWRKMAIQSPDAIRGSFFSTHPSHPERYLRMQKAIDEVNTKKSKGLPLLPNMKS